MHLRELADPTAAELVQLEADLGLSVELARAVSAQHPRVRLLVRDTGVVLVVRTHAAGSAGDGRGEVTAVVTEVGAAVIARGSPVVLAQVGDLLGSGTQMPSDVLLALVEVVVGDADAALERLDDEVERVEEGLFGTESVDHTQAIHAVKRELLEVRRSVVPLVADVTRLAQHWSATQPEDQGARLTVLLARAAHAAEGVEHLDALTSSVLTAQLAQIGVQQTLDQRKISAWAAIALVPTGVGAVYGMNFENMPELAWSLGYPTALLVILALCSFLYAGFRRNGWL